jgi:hypothetical protein
MLAPELEQPQIWPRDARRCSGGVAILTTSLLLGGYSVVVVVGRKILTGTSWYSAAGPDFDRFLKLFLRAEMSL